MKDKLIEYFNKIVESIKSKIPNLGNTQDSMAIVIAYGFLIIIVSLLFLLAWAYQGLKAGMFDTNIMLRFFEAVTAPGPVAAVTFLAVFFVDKNEDGRPDAAEEKAEKGGMGK